MPSPAQGQGTLISLPKRRDMVFDNAGKYLYISTADGLVKRYNLSAGQLDGSYNLGGSLWGIDIDPTDSFLLVGQTAQFAFQKIDLHIGTVTNIPYTPANDQEGGGWDVAIAANGKAFVTTTTTFQHDNPIREIDLATNALTVRREFFRPFAFVYRGVDASRLYFLDAFTSAGTVFTYNANTDTFGPDRDTRDAGAISNAAINRDGSLIATRASDHAAADTATDFVFVQAFHHVDGGVAFDGVQNILYGVDTISDTIIAFDVGTGAELYRLSIGEDLTAFQYITATGALAASPNGRYVAVQTPAGVRLFSLPVTLPNPTPAPSPTGSTVRDMVFSHDGNRLYISTRDGFVWPYRLADSAYEQPYYLGGILNALDISPDDSVLVVCQQNEGVAEGVFQKLDLTTRTITNIHFPLGVLEGGGRDVAVASNGFAYGITQSVSTAGGAGRLHVLDLSQNEEVSNSVLGDYGSVTRSADSSHIAFLSEFGFVTYDANTGTTGQYAEASDLSTTTLALNRDGSLAGTRIGITGYLNNPNDFKVLHQFTQISGGIAFDGVRDRLYGVNAVADQISGFNTGTFVEEVRIPIGEHAGQPQPLGKDNLVASPDGRFLALFTVARLKIFDLAAAPTPPPTPSPTPTPVPVTPLISVNAEGPYTVAALHEGEYATFTISAQPNSIRPVTVNYAFSGKAGYGSDYTLSSGLGPSGQITIPVGADSVSFVLTAVFDTTVEKKGESLVMKVLPGPGYKTVRKPQVKLKLYDNGR